jgi:hypothetical protein
MLAHPSGTGVDFSTPRPDHLSTRGNAPALSSPASHPPPIEIKHDGTGSWRGETLSASG